MQPDGGDNARVGHSEKRSGEDVAEEDSAPKVKKKRNRGQNKQREKFSNQRAAQSERLCKSILCDSVCSYGSSCKFSHDVADFISKKPLDLPEPCYNFQQFGKCPYGFACRFAKTHIEKVDGKYTNIVDESVTPTSKTFNYLSKDNLALLRKRKYDFSKAIDANRCARALVDQIVKRNVELNCTKKDRKEGVGNDADDTGEPVVSSDALPDTEDLKGAVSEDVKGEVSDKGEVLDSKKEISDLQSMDLQSKNNVADSDDANTKTSSNAIGALTNEDEFTIKPGEKKTIDFRNKLYLAPLTTV